MRQRLATMALEKAVIGAANEYVIDPMCAKFGVDPAYLARGLRFISFSACTKVPVFRLARLCIRRLGRAIETIEAGTRVWAYDTEAFWRLSKVERRLDLHHVGQMTTIEMNGETVTATGNHPFWVIAGENLTDRPAVAELTEEENAFNGAGRWVEARHLRPGDVLLARNGRSVTVRAVSMEKQSLAVYNLTIVDLHAYAVGFFGILVHNGNCAANKAAGDAFRDQVADGLSYEGFDVETEVFKRTPFGKRYIDIEVTKGGRVLGGIEAKYGSSRYLPLQRLKDAWLLKVGNYPVTIVRSR